MLHKLPLRYNYSLFSFNFLISTLIINITSGIEFDIPTYNTGCSDQFQRLSTFLSLPFLASMNQIGFVSLLASKYEREHVVPVFPCLA